MGETNRVQAFGLKLTSGFRKASSTMHKGYLDRTTDDWLECAKEDCDIGSFWRVHDKLYDLTDFVGKHPGGKFWLETTKGMDITEAFESGHLNNTVYDILHKYFVKDISTPRFSPFTFKNNGFYMTLKRKAICAVKGIKMGPSIKMKLIQDSIFVTFLSLLLLATLTSSYVVVMVAGIALTLSANCAHNFFHQKNNWRMYLFDFTLMSSQEWRISHAISHHLYANTIQDYEVFAFEPYLQFFPISRKNLVQKYLALTPLNVVYFIAFIADYFRRGYSFLVRNKKFEYPYLIQPVLLLMMIFINQSVWTAFILWNILHMSCNVSFFWIALGAGHHSEYAYVESDAANNDRDWGLHQIIAVAERKATMTSLLLASISFGNHTLHHLFPTLDHSKLHLLVEPLLETCKEFDVDFAVYSICDIYRTLPYRYYNTKSNDAPLRIKFGKKLISGEQ